MSFGEHALETKEAAFQEQKSIFLDQALKLLGYSSIDEAPDVRLRKPIALRPTIIENYRKLTKDELSEIVAAYLGELGVSHFLVSNPDDKGKFSHPMIEIADQLADRLPMKYPVDHPMEGHREAVTRFGPPDGTLKIYDLETRDGTQGYREQAETAEMFDAHNDGLGYAGAVEVFMLYADSAPLSGGYTYFQNVVSLALILAREDPDAFSSLFLPDAITALRPRGKGAIEVSTPVLFVNEQRQPQVFFRVQTGEYQIRWRHNNAALDRASRFLNLYAEPFSQGSTFIHLDRRGAGCIARNHWIVHGRTPFVDGRNDLNKRVLARKWFMCAEHHAHYKHVPGMHILDEFASIFPERFGPDRLEGDWNYDQSSGKNARKR
jgi:Taurine catabolism dioxygenase TauD, TfdA family